MAKRKEVLMNGSTIKSIIGVIIAVVLAGGIALTGSQSGHEVFGIPIFILAVAGAFLIQWVVFAIAYMKKSERFYDLTGSLTYISITTLSVLAIPEIDDRAVLLLVLVVVWATRLGTFLFTRVYKQGKDDRFDEIKVSFPRFLLTWTLQGLWVTFTAAAALTAITTTTRLELGWVSLIGIIIWAFGFFFELIADVQKSQFKANPENEGGFIHNGLWAWSRHPNYFGEIVLWIGVAVVALPVLRGWALLALVSPVWVILQLTLISGIPMLEKKADERWGGQEDYETYKRNTPVLFPRPPKRK
jgi:steroid 5-alpha reductase family enzyme